MPHTQPTNPCLTPEQIAYLFEFTRQKRVRYYDLQIELVDHLASAIEEKQAAAPHCSFEQALADVYQGFGIFGFARIVQAKERAIQRQAFREIGRFFRRLLSVDRLWIPLAVGLGFYALFRFLPLEQLGSRWVMVFAAVCYLPVLVLSVRYLIRSRRRRGKPFLILEMPNSLAIGAGMGLFGTSYSWVELVLTHFPHSTGVFIGLAGFNTLLILYAYAATIYLPRRAGELLREQFPQYATL